MKNILLLIAILFFSRLSAQVYTIPVVVHVLHEYGPENIPEWQIHDAIRILNEDYRKQNADTVNIVQSFKAIAADCEIEFKLATLDPNGNCTNGIDRIFTHKTILANDNSKLNPWPNNQYLNIWVASTLENSTTFGYAHFPGGINATDGIMMWHIAFGSIGTSQPDFSRSLTQQVGYYLNLRRPNMIVAGGCGDDYVADTPPTMGFSQCDTGNAAICNPPIIENVQNFMEGSWCQCMFTAGQKARMDSTLNSTVSGRNNLWTPSNLIATGTNAPGVLCSPRAQFVSTKYACAGDSITFKDASMNGPITGWSWTFPGGNPSASTDSMPVVIYNAPGLYDAKLVVTSGVGMDSISKTAIVQITDTPSFVMPYSEDFELPTSFPGIDGWIDNDDSSSVYHWDRVSTANSTAGGSYSIKMNNYTGALNDTDEWVTPSIDFSNITFPIHVTFFVSYAQNTITADDELSLLYSNDCGEHWNFATYNKAGQQLATAGIVSGDFTPTNSNQWRQETVACNAVQLQPNVRFKFRNISDAGNNIYVDDINITGSFVGIDEAHSTQNGFSIYPNPSNGSSNVVFKLNKQGHIKVSLKDVLGKTIASIKDESFQSGMHEVILPPVIPGIYFVDVSVDGKHSIRKWIVE